MRLLFRAAVYSPIVLLFAFTTGCRAEGAAPAAINPGDADAARALIRAAAVDDTQPAERRMTLHGELEPVGVKGHLDPLDVRFPDAPLKVETTLSPAKIQLPPIHLEVQPIAPIHITLDPIPLVLQPTTMPMTALFPQATPGKQTGSDSLQKSSAVESRYKTNATLAGELALPLVALLLGLYFRRVLVKLLEVITRLTDANNQIGITREELVLRILQGQMELVRSNQVGMSQELRETRTRAMAASIVPQEMNTLDQRLQRLVEDYQSLTAEAYPDYSERVRVKDIAAHELRAFVLHQSYPRDELAKQSGDGYIVALAGAIAARPEKGDSGRILQVAQRADGSHARYRVVLAIIALASTDMNLMDDAERLQLAKVVKDYEQGADPALLRLIGGAEAGLRLGDGG